MTISYQLKVANATFAGFPKLLGRWKGSVYKLMFKEFLVFSALYTTFSCVYRFALNDIQRRSFERLCIHIDETINHIPLTFVLGFYVSFVVSRWWEQLVSYPWPDRMLYLIVQYINGSDERSRMLRRTLARYLNASTILLTRSISVVAKKRFPSMDHMVEAGLLTKHELVLYDEVSIHYGKFWVPLVWFTQLIDQARDEGLINDNSGMAVKQIMDELLAFRSLLGKMFSYDWVSIPISYTQVVTLATYSYFLGCIFSRQFLDPTQKYKGHTVDVFVPIFTLLQFIFYVGWLKVAETLINPWGEDDDDFEVNWFVDRHVQVSYAIVDDMHRKAPPLVKDKYWGQTDVQVPYTAATIDDKRDDDLADLGSAMEYNVPIDKQGLSVSQLPSVSRRASVATSVASIHSTVLGRPGQWDAINGFGSRLRSSYSTGSGGLRDVYLSMPFDKAENMGTIVESPQPSEQSPYYGPPGNRFSYISAASDNVNDGKSTPRRKISNPGARYMALGDSTPLERLINLPSRTDSRDRITPLSSNNTTGDVRVSRSGPNLSPPVSPSSPDEESTTPLIRS